MISAEFDLHVSLEYKTKLKQEWDIVIGSFSFETLLSSRVPLLLNGLAVARTPPQSHQAFF